MSTVAHPVSDPVGDAMVQDLLTATQMGIEPNSYLSARNVGASHAQVIESVTHGLLLRNYAEIICAGAGHAEAIDMADRGIGSLSDYAQARLLGITHAEFLEYMGQNDGPVGQIGIRSALSAHELGATREDLVEYSATGNPMREYLECLVRGSLAREVMMALELGIDVFTYERALVAGVAHADILAAYTAGCHTDAYIGYRTCGSTHYQALSQAAS